MNDLLHYAGALFMGIGIGACIIVVAEGLAWTMRKLFECSATA